MDQFWQILNGSSPTSSLYSPESILLSLLLAFLLGQVLSWVYYITHSSLSYSKSFVQSLVLITVVVTMVMAVIGSSIVTAIGLMGALAIIRFRNIIKDTRDVAFIFCALVVGMAAGSQRFGIAIMGTIILSLIAIYQHWTSFGSHQPHNGFLRYRFADPTGTGNPVPDILKRFCSTFTLISVQNAGFDELADYAYQLMVRNAEKNEQLISELEKVSGIENISLTMQEQLLEV